MHISFLRKFVVVHKYTCVYFSKLSFLGESLTLFSRLEEMRCVFIEVLANAPKILLS